MNVMSNPNGLPPQVVYNTRVIMDINDFLWTNPGEVMSMFSMDDVLELFYTVMQQSIGEAYYHTEYIYEWVDSVLGFGVYDEGDSDLALTLDYIHTVYRNLETAFYDFIRNNIVLINATFGQVLANDSIMLTVKQLHKSQNIVMEFQSGE